MQEENAKMQTKIVKFHFEFEGVPNQQRYCSPLKYITGYTAHLYYWNIFLDNIILPKLATWTKKQVRGTIVCAND